MKKLATANPNLSYPERKAMLASFLPQELVSDSDVAGFIEKSGDSIESFVGAVRDEFCADTVVSWA
jgi:acetyl-CoA carboxylase/biotin carboxylase 1